MGTLSLSMIVKNEEKYLGACLESVKEIVDEIVIVDTGSEDRTKEIASEHGAKLYEFAWVDDFSAARNYALRHSTGDWILYMDADERLDPLSIDALKSVKNMNKHVGVAVTVTSSDETGGKPNTMKYFRIFRNHPDIVFKNKVHEQIYDSLKKHGYDFIDSDILIHHIGYDISKEELQKKAERNLKLLLEELEDEETGYVLYHIAQTYNILELKQQAAEFFQRAVQKDDLLDISKAHALRYLAASNFEKGDILKARALIDESLSLNSIQPLANLLAGRIYAISNEVEAAKEFYKKAAENNRKLLSGEIVAEFDIMADQEALLYNCIDFAVQAKDKQLFHYFYDQIASLPQKEYSHATTFNTSGINELPILKKLMDGSALDEGEVANLTKILNEKNLEAYLRLISSLTDQKQKLVILHSLSKKFIQHIAFLRAYAEALLQNGMNEESIQILHHAIQNDRNNPVLYFDLISALLQDLRFQEAYEFVQQGKNYFRNFEHVVKRFEIVESKIKPLLQ